MSKEELQIWFRNKFNNCYLVTSEDYPESIFMYYDTQFIRQKKLARIVGGEIIYPEKPSGILLFEQDYKNGYLYMDHDEITSFFYENYSPNLLDIKELIHGWLKDDTKLKVLTPYADEVISEELLKDDTKLKVLTPINLSKELLASLNDDTKLKVLTPWVLFTIPDKTLKDDTKLKVLTPSNIFNIYYKLMKDDTKLKVLTPPN